MSPLIPALGGAMVVAGVIGLVVALRRTPPRPTARPRSLMSVGAVARLRRMSRRTRYTLLGGLFIGAAIAVATGWLIAIVVVPAAAGGLPVLLSAPGSKARIERKEAIEEWSRSLAGVLVTGQTLRAALIKSVRTAPDTIHPEVATLGARLRSGTSVPDALVAFADDLDDATGDLVAVLLASTGEQPGRASVLEAIAQSVADDVRADRQIDADQNKPRTTARVITAITVGALGFLGFSGGYIEPYGTPVGQVILGLLLSAYVAVLLWMRSMAAGTPPPRFLVDQTPERNRP